MSCTNKDGKKILERKSDDKLQIKKEMKNIKNILDRITYIVFYETIILCDSCSPIDFIKPTCS